MTALYLGTHRHNSYPVGNLFVFVEFIIFLLIYQKAFTWKNGVVYWSAGIFTLVFFVNYALIQGPFVHNSYTSTLISVLLMVLSLMYFRFLLVELPETYAYRMPMIWINIAVLIYFSGNLFLFMLYNYFVSGIWTLHNMLNITKNVLFFIAIWQSQRKINSISS